jgi:hypothetical protein
MVASLTASGNGKSPSPQATGDQSSRRQQRYAKRATFIRIKAHLPHCRLQDITFFAAHAGAGGARTRSISARKSANTYRDTATSAI